MCLCPALLSTPTPACTVHRSSAFYARLGKPAPADRWFPATPILHTMLGIHLMVLDASSHPMTHSSSKRKGGRSSPTKGQNLFHGETSVVSQAVPCFSTLFCDPKDLDHLRLQAPISITAHQCQGQQLKAIEKRAKSSSGFLGKQLQRCQVHPPQSFSLLISPSLPSLPPSPLVPIPQNSLQSLLSLSKNLFPCLARSPSTQRILPLKSPYCRLPLQAIFNPHVKRLESLDVRTEFSPSL